MNCLQSRRSIVVVPTVHRVVWWLVNSFLACAAFGYAMPRRRTPQAFRGRGGRWIRVPRPRPTPKTPPQHQSEGDAKFRACAVCSDDELDSAYIAEAKPIILQLENMGSKEAAIVMSGLCDRLAARCQEAQRAMLTRHDRGLRNHLLWKARHLTRKLREANYKAVTAAEIQGDLYRQQTDHYRSHGEVNSRILADMCHSRRRHQHWPP